MFLPESHDFRFSLTGKWSSLDITSFSSNANLNSVPHCCLSQSRHHRVSRQLIFKKYPSKKVKKSLIDEVIINSWTCLEETTAGIFKCMNAVTVMLNITIVYLYDPIGTCRVSSIMTCNCRISIKIDRSKKLIGIGCWIIVFNYLKIEND